MTDTFYLLYCGSFLTNLSSISPSLSLSLSLSLPLLWCKNSFNWKWFIPAILSTVAIVLGTASNVYCETLSFPQDGTEATLDVSPFYYRTKDMVDFADETWVVTRCRNYKYLDKELGFDYDKFDAKSRTVRAFAVITPILGGLAMVYAWIAPCVPHSPSRWNGIGLLFLLSCIFQGLTLMVWTSSICTNNPVKQYLDAFYPESGETISDDCIKATGYTLNIISVVFWFLAGISIKAIPPPKPDFSEPVQEQTVTYQKNNDGTVQEQNVTIVQGAPVAAKPETAAVQVEAEEMPLEDKK